MGEYKQLRINFNSDNDEEIIAYKHLRSLGRKSSQYMINLILSDLKGESVSINHLTDDNTNHESLKNELKVVKERLSKSEEQYNELDKRLTLIENNRKNTEIAEVEDINKSPKQKENDITLATSISEDEDYEYDDSSSDIPKIPADIAARLGNF